MTPDLFREAPSSRSATDPAPALDRWPAVPGSPPHRPGHWAEALAGPRSISGVNRHCSWNSTGWASPPLRTMVSSNRLHHPRVTRKRHLSERRRCRVKRSASALGALVDRAVDTRDIGRGGGRSFTRNRTGPIRSRASIRLRDTWRTPPRGCRSRPSPSSHLHAERCVRELIVACTRSAGTPGTERSTGFSTPRNSTFIFVGEATSSGAMTW